MDHVADKINRDVQFVHHRRVLVRHVQQGPHERIHWVPNQLGKSITNERDEIVSQFMVVAKSQAIIPSDFIKVLSTEIDDGNDVIVKSRLRHALLVPSPMKPSIEGINRLIKPDVHECEEEIDLDHYLLLLSQEAALENRQHNAPKSAESCLGDRIAIAEKGILMKTVPAVQVIEVIELPRVSHE